MGGCFFPQLVGAFRFLPLVILLLAHGQPGSSYRDDWYGFASFEDTNEWKDSYKYTCDYSYDLFREPREFSQRDNLRGRRELLSPIAFQSKDAIKSPEDTTLHIYNNPAIRKAFSVSYGFQRNKECLHGQDADCVVFPELARVRAVVVNAERFGSKRQNLNYIKDHFLIEKPERFASILNGGSRLERKFYEAVFLGGYSDDPTRTSHQIDGKKYPLEIYMYFLDETVPSVSLSTILVVLVEENERDNAHIKPIINAIEHNLYDAERRFLENNKLMVRRERLFHHLKGSTYYDVYNTEQAEEGESISHESLDTSINHESLFTRYVEPFEKMQSLEADLFFLLEDFERVTLAWAKNQKVLDDFLARNFDTYFPSKFTEYQMMAVVALVRGYAASLKPKIISEYPTCRDMSYEYIANDKFFNHSETAAQFRNVSQVPRGAHSDALVQLTTIICEHFFRNFADLYNRNNKDESEMLHLEVDEKYQFIRDFIAERKQRQDLNMLVWEHFHNNQAFHPYNAGDEVPEYLDSRQQYHIVDGFVQLLLRREKRDNYEIVRLEIYRSIQQIVKKLEYADEVIMREVVRYLKFGTREKELKYYRHKVHKDFINRRLPVHQKKRTLVELGGMEISEEDIMTYEKLDPVTARVNEAFQISWLMPQTGGYYYYAGSSPIPPCFRADNVIVFKKPISMSKRQIEVLTRIPTSFDRSEDIRFTTPQVHDTKFEVDLSADDTEKARLEEVVVPVYFQPRNHLFLGHDGVHKNAVEEWENIKQKRKNGEAGITRASGMVLMVVIIKMIIL